jgi:hypothetical protein
MFPVIAEFRVSTTARASVSAHGAASEQAEPDPLGDA